jgi:hypothetical protein
MTAGVGLWLGLFPANQRWWAPKLACSLLSIPSTCSFAVHLIHPCCWLAGWLAGCVQDTITAAGYVLHMGSKPAGELKVGDSVTSK